MGVWICLRVRRFCRGIWAGWRDGPRPAVCGSIRQSAGSYPWVTTAPCTATALGKSALRIAQSIASSTKELIIPLYWELISPHLESCAQFWVAHFKNVIEVECVHRRAMKLVKGLENMCPMRSYWGSRGFKSGEEEGQGRPSLLSTWNKIVVRWGLVSSAISQVKGQEEWS